MCKRCSELEQEIEAAEEYGFGFTSFQLNEELEDLQASHLSKYAPDLKRARQNLTVKLPYSESLRG